MKTYNTGTKVPYGLYLSWKPLDFRFVGADDEPLNGKENALYRRLPTLLLLLSAPIVGGLFVLSFPIMILGMFIAAPIYGVYSFVKKDVEKITGHHHAHAHHHRRKH